MGRFSVYVQVTKVQRGFILSVFAEGFKEVMRNNLYNDEELKECLWNSLYEISSKKDIGLVICGDHFSQDYVRQVYEGSCQRVSNDNTWENYIKTGHKDLNHLSAKSVYEVSRYKTSVNNSQKQPPKQYAKIQGTNNKGKIEKKYEGGSGSGLFIILAIILIFMFKSCNGM